MIAVICCLLALSSAVFGLPQYSSYSSLPHTQNLGVSSMRDLTSQSQIPVQSDYGQQQQSTGYSSGLTSGIQQDTQTIPQQKSLLSGYGSSYGVQLNPQRSNIFADQNVVPQYNYGVQSRIAPAPRVLVSPQQQFLEQQESLMATEAGRLESIKNSYSELNLLSKTKPSDFIFDFDTAVTGVSRGTGGRTVAATSANFPGLINHGIAMTIGYLGPCGFNLPHTHPRATEINFSVDGDFIVGFYQENGAEFILNEVHKNQVAVFPKGAIHFEQNLNCVPATFVAAFNNEDPGVLTIANAFFGSLPATVVGASLGGLNITTVEDIRLQLAQNPSVGIIECRKRCGL